MLQAIPFHDSAIGRLAPPPTAVQVVAEAHETPESSTFTLLFGFGVVCRDQAVPFHLSASVEEIAAPGGTSLPTAVQAVTDEHDTAAKDAVSVFPGRGTSFIDHVVPSQVSASGISVVASAE